MVVAALLNPFTLAPGTPRRVEGLVRLDTVLLPTKLKYRRGKIFSQFCRGKNKGSEVVFCLQGSIKNLDSSAVQFLDQFNPQLKTFAAG